MYLSFEDALLYNIRISLLLDNYVKAEKLQRRALAGKRRQLGDCHSSTLKAADNLAEILRAQVHRHCTVAV